MADALREAATKARRLANGSNVDAYRESLADLGRAYLKAYPTAAALSVQGEPVAWQQRYIDPVEGPGLWQPCDENSRRILGSRTDYALRPLYAAPAAPAVPPDLLQQVRDALHRYHLALDFRMHGGVAAGEAINAIEQALGTPWVQGAARRAAAAPGAEGGE